MLRDGSAVQLRLAGPTDRDAITRFFHGLSFESLGRRFCGPAEPSRQMVETFCDASDAAKAVTLLALRLIDGSLRPIAVGSCFRIDASSAEVAFAVDDHFQNKGLGTVLLDRLAALAAAHGFTRFEAVTLSDNAAMLTVFHESGFEIHSKSERGGVSVQLSLDPTGRAIAAAERRDAVATVASLHPLLEPASVTVVGASRDPHSIGGRVLRALIAGGFDGPIYPVNPRATELDGLPCFPALAAIPRGVDLAVIAVPRRLVLEIVDQCAASGVRSLVVITAGFAESGAEGRALQDRLVERVRGHGLRMVGPNCMGLLNASPQRRLNASFWSIMPPAGRVAFSSQSGALGMAILGTGFRRSEIQPRQRWRGQRRARPHPGG